MRCLRIDLQVGIQEDWRGADLQGHQDPLVCSCDPHSPGGVARVCQGHVADTQFVEHAQSAEAAVNRVTSLQADHTTDFVVVESIPDSWRNKAKNYNVGLVSRTTLAVQGPALKPRRSNFPPQPTCRNRCLLQAKKLREESDSAPSHCWN